MRTDSAARSLSISVCARWTGDGHSVSLARLQFSPGHGFTGYTTIADFT